MPNKRVPAIHVIATILPQNCSMQAQRRTVPAVWNATVWISAPDDLRSSAFAGAVRKQSGAGQLDQVPIAANIESTVGCTWAAENCFAQVEF